MLNTMRLFFNMLAWQKTSLTSAGDRHSALVAASYHFERYSSESGCFSQKFRSVRLTKTLMVMRNEQMDEMLAHPFFGRERHEFPADNVENMRFPVNLLNFVTKSGKVQ
jgi:hypothetical protein